MERPTDDEIANLKSKFPNRSLHLVEAVDGEESHFFIMTGPNKEEYTKFTDDLLSAKDERDEKKKTSVLRKAVENTAIAMIRWPDRDVVKELFSNKPAMSANFSDHLHASAGSNFEVRSKNL